MPSTDSSRLRAFARCLFAALAVALALAALPAPACAEDSFESGAESSVNDLRCAGQEAFDASLIARAQQRVAAGAGDGAASSDIALQNISTTGDLSLSTTGKARVVVIRVSFPASPESGEPAMTIPASQTQDDLRAVFNGGTGSLTMDFPYESLHAYYERSSYGKLDIQASFVVDYMAQYGRSHYAANINELFYETLAGVEDQVDYSRCDANNDGKIDGVYLQFAGKDTGWGSVWWPSKYTLTDDSHTFGGKIARGAALLQSDLSTNSDLAVTIIHETGHMLGLPDLYHYQGGSDLGLKANDMMFNDTGEINGFCKWMLDWIDEDKIVYVHVSQNGVDVRRGIGGAIEHYDGAVDEVLAAFVQDDIEETGGFIAVSADESILEGNLLCNFYLVEYVQRAGNDAVSVGQIDMGEGLRIYRMQATCDSTGGFMHSNAYGGAHEQLIEALVPAEVGEESLGVFALWKPGSSVTPATSPSTNFGESLIKGFTGISLVAEEGEDGTGRVRIGYEPVPEQDPLALTYESMAINGSSGSYTFKLSRDVDSGWGRTPAKLIVDGVEYDASSWTYAEGERTLKVFVRLESSAIKPTSKIQVKMPAGAFVLAYDEQGLPAQTSEDLVCDVPTPNVCTLEAAGSYENATVPVDSMQLLSNIFELSGSRYFLTYSYSYDSSAVDLGLYRIAADGKSCEKVALEGATGLALEMANALDVVPYGDGLLFVRMRSYASQGDEVPLSVSDAVIDVAAGQVLAVDDGAPVYLAPRSGRLVAMGDCVVSARRMASGSWEGETYRVEDSAIASEHAEWTGDAAARVTALFDASEDYLAMAREDANGRGGTATVSLVKASELTGVSSLGSADPVLTVELEDNYGVNAVCVANGRLYVLACSNHMTGGRDHFANEMRVYDLVGNLLSTAETPEFSLLFSSRVDLRVSAEGAIAICRTDTNEAETLGMRGVQVFYDANLSSKGSLTNYARSIGAWVGERWLAVDYPLLSEDAPRPQSIAVSWALTEPMGASKPDDPSEPSDPAEPSGPSAPSTPASDKASKVAGALANTGDRTLALVAAVLTLGLILVIAGIIVARRKLR